MNRVGNERLDVFGEAAQCKNILVWPFADIESYRLIQSIEIDVFLNKT
jgi:hypothetical protein